MANTTDECLLSIIVPIYNTEECFLEQCFKSIAVLDARVEVVIVDDGSDEETKQVISELAHHISTRHEIISRKNGGQNAARNLGISLAHGDYLFFLDSDDFVDTDALNHVCDILENNNPQMLGFNDRIVNVDSNVTRIRRRFCSNYAPVNRENFLVSGCSLCTQVYRRDLFDGYSLLEGVFVGEDLASLVPIVLSVEQFYSTDTVLYNYVQRSSSITHTFSPSLAFENIKAFDALLDRCGVVTNAYHDTVEWLAILHVLYFGGKRIIETFGPSKEARRHLFEYVNSKFPGWRANPILARECKNWGCSFSLIVRGHWYLYTLMKRLWLVTRVGTGGQIKTVPPVRKNGAALTRYNG